MRAKTITLAKVESFVRGCLPDLLKQDLRDFKLLRESDLECSAYMHLRHFLDADARWKVTARRHVPMTGYYVDLVIFEDAVPRIAIELKWGQRSIGPKDRSSLGAALQKLGVNKAYWISGSVLGQSALPIVREAHERNVLHQLVVRADLTDKQRGHWIALRNSLRSKMRTGQGRKLISEPVGRDSRGV